MSIDAAREHAAVLNLGSSWRASGIGKGKESGCTQIYPVRGIDSIWDEE